MRRGEIWWASLRPPAGSAPGFRRPVLVIQANEFNESRIATVVIAAMTSNVRLAEAPGNVLCRRRECGLPCDSVVNVSQILTIDKTFLSQRIRMLPTHLLMRVEEGLKLVLNL